MRYIEKSLYIYKYKACGNSNWLAIPEFQNFNMLSVWLKTTFIINHSLFQNIFDLISNCFGENLKLQGFQGLQLSLVTIFTLIILLVKLQRRIKKWKIYKYQQPTKNDVLFEKKKLCYFVNLLLSWLDFFEETWLPN